MGYLVIIPWPPPHLAGAAFTVRAPPSGGEYTAVRLDCSNATGSARLLFANAAGCAVSSDS